MRAKSILKSVRDVRACGSFLGVRCAITLLHTFWNKTDKKWHFNTNFKKREIWIFLIFGDFFVFFTQFSLLFDQCMKLSNINVLLPRCLILGEKNVQNFVGFFENGNFMTFHIRIVYFAMKAAIFSDNLPYLR